MLEIWIAAYAGMAVGAAIMLIIVKNTNKTIIEKAVKKSMMFFVADLAKAAVDLNAQEIVGRVIARATTKN